MGKGLGGEYAAAMKEACSLRNFKIKCDTVCYFRFPGTRYPPVESGDVCGQGFKSERTIILYATFWNDKCGTKPCVIGHELLHMVAGLPHHDSDRTFDLLYHCLGCE